MRSEAAGSHRLPSRDRSNTVSNPSERTTNRTLVKLAVKTDKLKQGTCSRSGSRSHKVQGYVKVKVKRKSLSHEGHCYTKVKVIRRSLSDEGQGYTKVNVVPRCLVYIT